MQARSTVSNVLRFAVALPLLIVTIPLAALAGVASRMFGLKRNMSAQDVAQELRDFLEGCGGAAAWDDFTTLAIADPKLDHIREQAFEVGLPLTKDGRVKLRELLEEAERLALEQAD